MSKIIGDDIGSVKLLQHMGEDITIVNAARASLDKFSTEFGPLEERLLKFVTKHGHTSTFEHNFATFYFKVPMFVARQHMRHRTFSYNEISRRYTAENIEFFVPDHFRAQDTKNRQASLPDQIEGDVSFNGERVPGLEAVRQQAAQSLDLYNQLIDLGVAREQARGVLSQNIYTTYWASGNLHNWLNSFVAKRAHPDAQHEMQLVAREVYAQLVKLWPKSCTEWAKHKDVNLC